ncbi:MAG: MoaD/ThiS family protein [Deltaproteobacteria bacterium]|nr:MoaD/ThiS family protein [Deltaproteobacteria bacterium]
MIVTVRLISYLSDARFDLAEVTLDQGARVDDLLGRLALTRLDVGLILINGQSCKYTHALGDRDQVTLIPHMGGG